MDRQTGTEFGVEREPNHGSLRDDRYRQAGATPTVSVIIPYSKPSKIDNCITSIVNQRYPKEQLEIIVVGKGSSEVADRWPEVLAIDTGPIFKPGKARNLGAAAARGDYLLFIDDDCLAERNWVEENISELDRGSIGAVSGMITGKANGAASRAVDYSNFSLCQINQRSVRPICSATFAIKRDLFDEVGGFDEGLTVHEDIDISHRLERIGHPTVYQPKVRIIHDHGRNSLSQLVSYLYFGGRHGGLIVEQRHKDLSRFYRQLLRFNNPITYSLMAIPFAIAATARAIQINIKSDHRILWLSPLIFLGKLSCHLGIARKLFEDWKKGKWKIYGVVQNARRFVEYSLLKRFIKSPRILTLFVTSQCNAKCGHCFYWQELNQPTDMSLEDIRKLSEGLGKLDKLLITGGEPTLSKDLPEICRMFFENNDVNFVSIPTNGLLPEMIYARIRDVLLVAGGRTVNVSFSLDGLAEVHDELRGVPGNFEKVVESYERLRDLQADYQNLSLRVNSVLMNQTVDSVEGLIDAFEDLFPEINTPALTLLRGSPYDKSLQLPEVSRLRSLHKYKLTKNPGKQPRIWQLADWATFNASLEILRQDTQVVPCEAGRILGVVEANGDVKHCELLPSIGNLKDGSFHEIWNSEKAANERQKIVAKECKCTHECNLFPSMMAHPIDAASALGRSVLRDDDT